MNEETEAKRRERMMLVNTLHLQGKSMREIGSLLESTVSAQRVGQIFKQGVELGLYFDQRPTRAVQRMEARTRRAADRAERIRQRDLRPSSTERRAIEKSAARERVISQYKSIAASLGKNPTTSDIRGTGLIVRIYRHFGSFDAFMSFLGERPGYVKPSWKLRDACRARDPSP